MDHLVNIGSMIRPALENAINFDEQKQTLKRALEELGSKAADVSIEVERAESSSGKRRKNEVAYWLKEAERVQDDGQRILQEQELGSWSTLFENRIKDRTAEVKEWIQKGRFEGKLVLDAYEPEDNVYPVEKMVGQKFQMNMDKILEYLVNDETLRIGICGMGGVGKTTLITHINNEMVNKLNTFGSVFWITVSQDFSIYRLQSLVAKSIGYDLDEEDEKKRAAKLSKAVDKKGKCILILDDLWNAFSEVEVGIPIKANGCKLILTTRSSEICQRMLCQQVKLNPLTEIEANSLFMEILGCEIPLPPKIEEIAKSIVKECDGLPLGIKTMAGCMRGVKEVCEWRNALRELRESSHDDMEDQVFKVLRYSYKRLNNPALEQCFLYCALFPEDHMIRRWMLIEYLIVEGIIGRMGSRQEQIDKGHVMLNKLEKACMLEGGTTGDDTRYVKMHDLVRDMALQTMKSGPYAAMVDAGKQLKKMSETQHWAEDLLRVSLIDNVFEEIPSTLSPRCSNLKTLLLSNNLDLVRIANSLFDYLSSLSVLDLSSCRSIKKLPDSVGDLENLTALLLRGCSELKGVPSLAKLRKLRKLDLSMSGVKKVPEGVEMMSNLTYLSFIKSKIKDIQPGILRKLYHLQYLGLHCTSQTIIDEVACLDKLEFLFCYFIIAKDYNSRCLSLLMDGKQLSKFFILVATHFKQEYWDSDGEAESPDDFEDLDLICRSVKLRCSIKEIQLPIDTLDLSIRCDDHDERVFCIKNAIALETLTIFRGNMMEYLFDASSSNVKIIEFLELDNKQALFSGEDETASASTTISLPPNAFFSNLQSFHISRSHRMKKLFHPALIENIPNLEELGIYDCEEMEEIIAVEEQEDEGSGRSQTRELSLPKLRVLSLCSMPLLKSIYSGKMVCSSLQVIELWDCNKLENIPISLPLPCLKELRVYTGEWWKSVEWDHSTDKSVLQPFCKIEPR